MSRTASISLLFGIVLLAFATAPCNAFAPDDPLSLNPLQPGGDVLRPGGGKLPWYIGLDGGITYSMFSGGPVRLAPLFNPYRPTMPTAQREAFCGTGNGLGFYIGATIDIPFSKTVAFVGKVNYHTRVGNFESNTTEVTSLLFPDTVFYHQKLKWTFNYIGIDLLLRYQVVEKSLYVLGGFGYGNLSKNTAKLDENITNANHFYIEDDPSLTDPLARKITTLSSETEITNVSKSRFDLKLGLGTWIEVAPKIFVTPEVLIALPLTKFSPDFEYTMNTLFATIGVRWQM